MSTIGRDGITLYSNGYRVVAIAKVLRVSKPELLIAIMDELLKEKGLEHFNKLHKQACNTK